MTGTPLPVPTAWTIDTDRSVVGHTVVIFASRETPEVLRQTISAASVASEHALAADTVSVQCAVIDVLVNGNPTLAEAAAQHTKAICVNVTSALRLRVWHLALADKAHAWNQYVEAIWPGSGLAFFVDGYVRLWPATIARLAQRVGTSSMALAGSGVPTVGRSVAAETRAMLAEGGIHGNCFCITAATLQQMKRAGFRLPLGLYRGDAMIGAVLAYRLDPAQHAWDLKNAVLVEPKASWDMQGMRYWRLADWHALWRRRGRQAQGRLENLAMRDHLSIRRLPVRALPRTVAELVLDWAQRHPEEAAKACRSDRRVAQALGGFQTPRDWHAAELAPALVMDTAALA